MDDKEIKKTDVVEDNSWEANPKSTYEAWQLDPSPANMSKVLSSLDTTLNTEIQRYPGPRPLLKGRAKVLAMDAVRKYDPTRGAQLRSWVVTNLQPLSRYGQQLRPIHASEMAIRQAAEVNRVSEELADDLGREPTLDELADEIGLSKKRIQQVRNSVKATVSESVFTEGDDSGEGTKSSPGVVPYDTLTTAKEMVYESLNTRDKQIYDWKIGAHGKPVLPNRLIAKRLGVTPALISQRSQQMAYQIRDLANKRG